jgi:RNA polymerase sigma factor (sigma-70 family)
MKNHPDQRFIDGIRAGNSNIIKELYQVFFPEIEKFILKNRGSKDDAHDVFQEGMYMLHHEIMHKDFKAFTGLNNWLFVVCRNIWYQSLKKKSRLPAASELEADTISDDANIVESMITYERKKLYKAKFVKLSDACQQILTLFFEKIKLAKIAEELGYKNINVVKKKKSLCQKKLIELILADPLYKELAN